MVSFIRGFAGCRFDGWSPQVKVLRTGVERVGLLCRTLSINSSAGSCFRGRNHGPCLVKQCLSMFRMCRHRLGACWAGAMGETAI